METEIPKQLLNKKLGLCKVLKGEKAAFEIKWQKNTYKFDDTELKKHIDAGGNYGVVAGVGKLRILDIDNKKLIKKFDKIFKDTLIVKTASGNRHYYMVSDYDKNHKFKDKDGEFRAKDCMVVGPGSEAKKNKYIIINDKPIKTISRNDLKSILKNLLINSSEKTNKNGTDTTRSGKEWAEICRLIKKGLSKKNIFKQMECFKKWAESSEQYRDHTYNKALKQIEKEDSKYDDVDLKKLNEEDFRKFCAHVRNLYKRDKRKEGEAIIVKYLMQNYTFLTPEDSKEIYFYNEGIYIGNGEALVGKTIQKILGTFNSNHNTSEIIGHIKRTTYIKRDKFIEPINLICLQNGILNIDTLKVDKFTPSIVFLNKINASYNPTADCPKIKEFLKQVLMKREEWGDEGADRTDLITIQEFTGYLLYKKIIFNRAVMLYGEGENGKSTCINLIKKFLDVKNISNIAIQKLESNNFAVSHLEGKLANLHSDLPKTALKETSKFKQLTGGDSVNAEKKFKDTYSFTPYAKMMFAANTLPMTYDDTRAFWRRWLIFNFPNCFEENKEGTKKNIIEELTTEGELSGMLNWAIEGLKRLLTKQKFTINKSTNEIREEYIRRSDSIGAFILDRIIETPGKHIIKKILYQAYVDYCRKRAYDMVTENVFHRRFLQKANVREFHPQGKDRKQESAWSGVMFKMVAGEKSNEGDSNSYNEWFN